MIIKMDVNDNGHICVSLSISRVVVLPLNMFLNQIKLSLTSQTLNQLWLAT